MHNLQLIDMLSNSMVANGATRQVVKNTLIFRWIVMFSHRILSYPQLSCESLFSRLLSFIYRVTTFSNQNLSPTRNTIHRVFVYERIISIHRNILTVRSRVKVTSTRISCRVNLILQTVLRMSIYLCNLLHFFHP